MSAKETLQIILITYNREVHLKNTLRQLLAETSPVRNYELLVLDNHSTDGTEALVRETMQTHVNLRYQKNNYNLGISGNIAKAMEIASNAYDNRATTHRVEKLTNDGSGCPDPTKQPLKLIQNRQR